VFAFTQNEIDQIEAARDAGDYHVAYEFIYTFASDTDANGNMTPKALRDATARRLRMYSGCALVALSKSSGNYNHIKSKGENSA